jgi:hypothetical protein
LVRREQRARAAKTGCDLVADQQHVVFDARGAEAREAGPIRELHAGGTLHERLDDHRRELGRVSHDELDRRVEARGIVECGRADHGKPQGVEDVGAESVVANGKRAHRVAVISAAEREKGAPRSPEVRPVLERDLQGLFHRRRAVGCIEKVRVVDGHDARQGLGELDHRTVPVAEHRRMCAERQLLTDRIVELWDAMAQRVDPKRGDGVEVAIAVDVDQLVALGPLDNDRVVLVERRHLGEAVPHDGRIPLNPVFCGHRR